jgi:hypothetical protein
VEESGINEHGGKALRLDMEECNVVHSIVMDNYGITNRRRPPPYVSYCMGLDDDALLLHKRQQTFKDMEEHLKGEACVGIKIHLRHTAYELDNDVYIPFYQMAARYNKVIAIHSGDVNHCCCVPVDIANKHYYTRFVLCHFGNPWYDEMALMLEDCDNVYVDLAGLLIGQKRHIGLIREWITRGKNHTKFLYGTDWPYNLMTDARELVSWAIPPKYHEDVFYRNALNVYKIRGLQ